MGRSFPPRPGRLAQAVLAALAAAPFVAIAAFALLSVMATACLGERFQPERHVLSHVERIS